MRGHKRFASTTRINSGMTRRRLSLQLACAVAFIACLGCTSSLNRWASRGWVADYDTAEQRIRKSGRELLIFYRDTRRNANHSAEEALKSEPLDGLTKDYVRCVLFNSYEPDRRYVAQFGVNRAPALIIVHGDGTYHAWSGSIPTAKIAGFLADARPPGDRPIINPHIPRWANYEWHRSIEEAEEASRQTGREVLIVFYRSLSRDWGRLKKLLSHHEVYCRFADMVHCRIGRTAFSADAVVTRFGNLRFPALVILRPDGTHEVLELPTCYEAIVRFTDAARRRFGGAALSRQFSAFGHGRPSTDAEHEPAP